MSESMRMWTEIVFNTVYLIVVWGLVIAMITRHKNMPESERPLRRILIWMFALLALGDTGHVGFRVVAFLSGDLEKTISLFGKEAGLVGLGALSTAVTVTFFYMLAVWLWKVRFNKDFGWFAWLLIAAGVVRLVIMAFPQNQWNSVVPPFGWSMARNIPLVLQGLGVAYLILRDSVKTKDRVFRWVGYSILVSYGFYLLVILFVQVLPVIGMLMIPKTLAYVAIAIIGYRALFVQPPNQQHSAVTQAANQS